MAEKILMPRLSDTMTEGVIASWGKNVGETVKKGDILAEIETDKATMELESYKDGVLLHQGAKPGEKILVNDLLAIIGKEGEDIKGLLSGEGGSESAGSAEARPADEQVADTKTPDTDQAKTEPEQKPAEPAQSSGDTPADLSKFSEVVLMPRLSDTMTEGVIATWNKNVGDAVKKGDVLAEIETDKATMELESYKDGVLLHQGAKAGEKIEVNALLAIIGAKDFDISQVLNAGKGGSSAQAQPKQEAAPKEEKPAAGKESKPAPKAAEAAPQPVNEGRVLASPLAKKMAADKGLDLRYVKGTGDNGRITRTDVENYKDETPKAAEAAPEKAAEKAAQAPQPTGQQPEAKSSAPAPAAKAPAAGQYEDVPVSQMRKVIARRLSESLFTAPHFYLTMKINMDEAISTRTKLNELSEVKISFNDLVLKAVATALRKHPAVNSSWLGDTIRFNKVVNIGVAVAVDEGLLVPVVRNADAKGLSEISNEVKTFAKKAKDKKLQPSDWEGSTFTISNLGMFGIDEFTAIINPPDACILAVGGISKEPVVKGDEIVVGNVMKVTLSCDHRVVDGATGAAFLQTVKSLLEEPLRMII